MAAVLTAWSLGVTAAVLLSPLRVWLALALGVAIAVMLIDRQRALLAGLALVALLIGAGRGALAATVELPRDLAGQNVSVSGIVDDDPVERKASRRLTVRVDHVLTGAAQTPAGLRIEATVYGLTPVRYGDLVLLNGEIQEPGETISGYRNRIRVRRALERLAAGERSLSRLAADLGFTDHSHLVRALRQEVHAPPSRLRSQLRDDIHVVN